jgi:hypothetical protein
MQQRLNSDTPEGSPSIGDDDRTDAEEEVDRTRYVKSFSTIQVLMLQVCRSSCEAIERIEDMVTSLLTQLAFSGPSFRTRGSMSDETSDSPSEATDLNAKVPQVKDRSRVELQLVDRNKATISGSEYLTSDALTSTLTSRPVLSTTNISDIHASPLRVAQSRLVRG